MLSIKVRPHYAVRRNATICSFVARQKLLSICCQCDRVYMENKFCRPSSGYKNCGTRLVNFVRFFSQTGWYHFETPMPHGFLWWDRQFADQIFKPRSIERHAAAELTQRSHILAAWRDFCCVASAVSRCATRLVWTYLYQFLQCSIILHICGHAWEIIVPEVN